MKSENKGHEKIIIEKKAEIDESKTKASSVFNGFMSDFFSDGSAEP